MATEWGKVPQEVIDLATEIIKEHHPDLEDFAIGFIFRSEASVSGGKLKIGEASKVTGKYSPFVDLDGLIWLARDQYYGLSIHQRRALIDHELCHFTLNEGNLTIRGHDIEEFKCIVERYGLWKSDLIDFAPAVVQVATQARLPGYERNGGGVVAVEPEILRVEVVGALA